MIKLEKTDVYGWEAAIRGMRNPMNSWERSDSHYCTATCSDECIGCDSFMQLDGAHSFCTDPLTLGPNDHDLMMRLAKGGATHAKYRRMITVTVDITAPLYWWKEFDTYKVGTVANSCSTMHKIHDKEFTLEDFSCEHLHANELSLFEAIIDVLNENRDGYIATKNKDAYWWPMIQLLPSSYNQKRTVMLNYEVLTAMYNDRKAHKLDEWLDFCKWIKELPYSELITGEEEHDD